MSSSVKRNVFRALINAPLKLHQGNQSTFICFRGYPASSMLFYFVSSRFSGFSWLLVSGFCWVLVPSYGSLSTLSHHHQSLCVQVRQDEHHQLKMSLQPLIQQLHGALEELEGRASTGIIKATELETSLGVLFSQEMRSPKGLSVSIFSHPLK